MAEIAATVIGTNLVLDYGTHERAIVAMEAIEAAPQETGLDVERLAKAVMRTDLVAMPSGWPGYQEWAERIAAEYAALAAAPEPAEDRQ